MLRRQEGSQEPVYFFGIPRSSSYRYHNLCIQGGEAGLANEKHVAKSHPNAPPREAVELVQYPRAGPAPKVNGRQ